MMKASKTVHEKRIAFDRGKKKTPNEVTPIESE